MFLLIFLNFGEGSITCVLGPKLMWQGDQIKNWHSWKNEKYFCSFPSGFVDCDPELPLVPKKKYMQWGRALCEGGRSGDLSGDGTYIWLPPQARRHMIQFPHSLGTWGPWSLSMQTWDWGGSQSPECHHCWAMENIQGAEWETEGMISPPTNGTCRLRSGAILMTAINTNARLFLQTFL